MKKVDFGIKLGMFKRPKSSEVPGRAPVNSFTLSLRSCKSTQKLSLRSCKSTQKLS